MFHLDVEDTISKLSIDEKFNLLSGIDFWHTYAVPRLGVPSVRMSDGPNGVRGTRFFNGVPAACFPCGTCSKSARFERRGLKRSCRYWLGVYMGQGSHPVWW